MKWKTQLTYNNEYKSSQAETVANPERCWQAVRQKSTCLHYAHDTRAINRLWLRVLACLAYRSGIGFVCYQILVSIRTPHYSKIPSQKLACMWLKDLWLVADYCLHFHFLLVVRRKINNLIVIILNSSSTSLSATFIFGVSNSLSDVLWNEKPTPEVGVRVYVWRRSLTRASWTSGEYTCQSQVSWSGYTAASSITMNIRSPWCLNAMASFRSCTLLS